MESVESVGAKCVSTSCARKAGEIPERKAAAEILGHTEVEKPQKAQAGGEIVEGAAAAKAEQTQSIVETFKKKIASFGRLASVALHHESSRAGLGSCETSTA